MLELRAISWRRSLCSSKNRALEMVLLMYERWKSAQWGSLLKSTFLRLRNSYNCLTDVGKVLIKVRQRRVNKGRPVGVISGRWRMETLPAGPATVAALHPFRCDATERNFGLWRTCCCRLHQGGIIEPHQRHSDFLTWWKTENKCHHAEISLN